MVFTRLLLSSIANCLFTFVIGMISTKKQILLALGLLLFSCSFAQGIDTTQQVISGRKNSIEQQKKPYVIMISVDGMRYDYATKYKAAHLLNLAHTGVKAEYLIP